MSKLDLDSFKLNRHARCLGPRSFSSSYCPDAQTHTSQISWTTWTTKVLVKNV